MAEMTNMELITQPIKEAYVRIELRAQDGGLLENLEGELLTLSGNVDSDSDIRRTATIELHLDKYIALSVSKN